MSAALALGGWACALALAAALLANVTACRRRLELVARAEHELRGPATALVLAVDALAAAGGVPPTVSGAGKDRRAGDANSRGELGERRLGMLHHHLDRLRLGLSDLEAAQRGRTSGARPRRVELRAVAREASAAWSPAAARAGRPLRLDWRAGPAPAFADRARLSQAVGNLLANAVEHGAGPLELHGRRDGTVVRLEVRNDARRAGAGGGGAAARAATRRGRARRLAGARQRGLGLVIARDALTHAGGRLEPPAPDGPAVAAIELPVDEGA